MLLLKALLHCRYLNTFCFVSWTKDVPIVRTNIRTVYYHCPVSTLWCFRHDVAYVQQTNLVNFWMLNKIVFHWLIDWLIDWLIVKIELKLPLNTSQSKNCLFSEAIQQWPPLYVEYWEKGKWLLLSGFAKFLSILFTTMYPCLWWGPCRSYW